MDPDFLKHSVFFDECIFSLGPTENKKNCRICGSEVSQIVYEFPQSASTLMLWCAISKTKILSLFWGRNSYCREKRNVVTLFFVSQACKISVWHDFSTGGSLFALFEYSKIISSQWACKKMDGKGSSTFIVFSISWFDPWDFFIWSNIKDPVHRDFSENNTDLKAILCRAIISISEETPQKLFENFKNRVSFVLTQNYHNLKNVLK